MLLLALRAIYRAGAPQRQAEANRQRKAELEKEIRLREEAVRLRDTYPTLARWIHGTNSINSKADFIAYAEKMGLSNVTVDDSIFGVVHVTGTIANTPWASSRDMRAKLEETINNDFMYKVPAMIKASATVEWSVAWPPAWP